MYLVLIANFLLIQSIHSANHGAGWYHVGAGVGDDIRGHHMRDVLELMEDVKNFQYDEQAVVEEGASQSGLVVQAALQIVVQIERGGMVQISVLEVEGGVVAMQSAAIVAALIINAAAHDVERRIDIERPSADVGRALIVELQHHLVGVAQLTTVVAIRA